MSRFATFLIVLIVSGGIAYLLAHRNGPVLRSFTSPSVSIDELMKSARDYDGKVIKVSGVVIGSVGFLGIGGFLLRDPNGVGEIMVMASGGIPPEGTTMTIIGKFKQAVVIGNFQYAVIMRI